MMKQNILFLTFFLSGIYLFSQVEKSAGDSIKFNVRTATDLKTGNGLDVLPDFFQLALKDLNGSSHSFSFQSSLFAIQAKTDSSLWVDTTYLRKTFARNLVVGVALALDSNRRFKSNSLNLKYALWNKRDKSVYDYSFNIGRYDYEAASIDGATYYEYSLSTPSPSIEDLKKVEAYKDGEIKYDSLPKKYKEILKRRMKENTLFTNVKPDSVKDFFDSMYKAVSVDIGRRALWTVEANLSSDPNKIFSTADFNSEFLKGMIKKKAAMNIELDAKASFNLSKDTANKNRNMNRQIASASVGLNWIILKNPTEQKSILEFKADISLNYILNGIYIGEEKQSVTANGTLRLRVSDDFWIPVKITYEPKTGNVYGFLNFTANFDALGKMLK